MCMEMGILISVYMVYSFSRGSIDAKGATAFQHARDLFGFEKALGIDFELGIQSLFLANSALTHVANLLYTVCYYPALIIFGIWAYWFHRRKYKIIRTVFVISAALAFAVFALYPLAPPRFFDGGINRAEDLGFVDTIAVHWGVNEAIDQPFYNPFAAMPSLHCGWTVMIAGGVIWMTKSRWGRAVAILLPVAMFVGTTSTANHFILDAIGGYVLIAVAFAAAPFTTGAWRRIFNRSRGGFSSKR